MVIDIVSDLHEIYPKGTIWRDSSSYKKEDDKNDYYMMFDKWKFIGRFNNWLDAMGNWVKDDR